MAVATSRPLANAVEVRIGAVLASNSGKEFDQRLASMQRQFNTLFAYSSYRLVKEQRQQVAWGEKVGFDIPGGRYVVVIPKEFKDNRVLMKVMVIEGSRPIVDTACRCATTPLFWWAGRASTMASSSCRSAPIRCTDVLSTAAADRT